jgi:hypothetical protein
MDSFLNDAGPELGERRTTIPEEVPEDPLDLIVNALTTDAHSTETPVQVAVITTHHLHPLDGTLHHLRVIPPGSTEELYIDIPEDPRDVSKLLMEGIEKAYQKGLADAREDYVQHQRQEQHQNRAQTAVQEWGGDLELLRSVGAIGERTLGDDAQIIKEIHEAYANGLDIEVWDEADKAWKKLPKLLTQLTIPANLDHVRIAKTVGV